MHLVYLVSAAGGGALLVLQILLSLLGAGHDGDVHFDHADVAHGDASHEGAGVGVSFRAVVAFVTFFGIGGMGSDRAGLGGLATLAVAFVCGITGFALVTFALVQFGKLRSSGTVDIKRAVGSEGKVYLGVPANKSGTGSVTVAIQGRTMQFHAITSGAAIQTGAMCRVIAVHANDTLEVEPA